MKREFYEFAGEVSDDNVIETELREELIAKDFIKKINRSFARNIVWMALNSVALSILSLIFQTLGIKILVSGSMYTLLMLGLGISYLLIFVGTILMNLQPIKTNELFKDLILLFQLLSPFIALTYLSQLGVVLSGMGSVAFFVTFLLVRWPIIKKCFAAFN
jgi:hypothetical protein